LHTEFEVKGYHGFSDTAVDGNAHSEIYNDAETNSLTLDRTQNADGTFTTRTEASDGSWESVLHNATGTAVSDSWARAADGSHGEDTFDSDGSVDGITYYADGTYSTYSREADGDAELDYFSAEGTQSRDAWWHSDGTYGGDVSYSDGSSYSTQHNLNDTWDTYLTDPQGQTVHTVFEADGASHVVPA